MLPLSSPNIWSYLCDCSRTALNWTLSKQRHRPMCRVLNDAIQTQSEQYGLVLRGMHTLPKWICYPMMVRRFPMIFPKLYNEPAGHSEYPSTLKEPRWCGQVASLVGEVKRHLGGNKLTPSDNVVIIGLLYRPQIGRKLDPRKEYQRTYWQLSIYLGTTIDVVSR